tara:strand:+ start:5220 stop:5975 length:756 start_codon:yes stop_codon:yes gene_type:complete
MATPNYTNEASNYNTKFTGQGRSNDSAAVTANEQFDRDNLLHFIEDNFKTNVKGGIKAENVRAFLHTLVKSVEVIADDKTFGSLAAGSFRVGATAADRWYYGSGTYGWAYFAWTQFTTVSLSNTVSPSILGQYSHLGIEVPFEVFDVKISGTVLNSSQAGNVDIIAFYADQDDGTNASLQNATFIGQKTVNCAVVSTGYDFAVESVAGSKIARGKKIFLFVKASSHTGGTDFVKVSWNISYSKRSTNYTAS